MAEPWFRMHANPTKLKVTARLMEYTKIDKARAVGYLATFWGALSQHCPGGVVSDIPDSLLEEWAEWKGKRGAFASFVRFLHSRDGKVNDYDEYSGKLEERKARDRERKAAAQAARNGDGNPQEEEQNSDGIPEEVRTTSSDTIRYETKRNEETTEKPSSSKKRRAEPLPWMGRVIEAWQLTYPGSRPPPGTANALKPLFTRMGEDAAVLELQTYLADTPTTYLNFGKFAATAGIEVKTPNNNYTPRLSPADKVSQAIAEAVSGGLVS